MPMDDNRLADENLKQARINILQRANRLRATAKLLSTQLDSAVSSRVGSMGRQMTAAYNDAYDRIVTASDHDRTDLTLRNTAMKTGASRTTRTENNELAARMFVHA